MPYPSPTSPIIGDLPDLPARVDRKRGAEIISRLFFPVKPRTLEVWPVEARRINNKALYETAALIAHAQSMVDAAPMARCCRKAPL